MGYGKLTASFKQTRMGVKKKNKRKSIITHVRESSKVYTWLHKVSMSIGRDDILGNYGNKLGLLFRLLLYFGWIGFVVKNFS
jgi:hypothetical protein